MKWIRRLRALYGEPWSLQQHENVKDLQRRSRPESGETDRVQAVDRPMERPPAKSLLPQSLRPADVETLLIGGLLPFLILWVLPGEARSTVIPLLFLPPLMLGLRYGSREGSVGAILTAAALAWVSHLQPGGLAAQVGIQIVGLVLTGMIAGEARDIWARRLARLSQQARYHQARLEQFTAAYQLLKVSHTQLEQRLVGAEPSLRSALELLKLREKRFLLDQHLPLSGTAQELITILAEQGNLYTAAIYEVNARGLVQTPAAARVGDPPELSVFNPLLRETLKTGLLTSANMGYEASHEHVIAVVPLVDSSGRIHAVVSINDMPFDRVNNDTFSLMAVLGKHMGDILARLTRSAADARDGMDLQTSLQRHWVDVNAYGLHVAVISCKVVDTARREALLALCSASGRGLDESWLCEDTTNRPVVIKVLPLTDQEGATAYIARLQKARVDGAPARNGLVTNLWLLGQHSDAGKLLAEIQSTCEIASFSSTVELTAPTAQEAVL